MLGGGGEFGVALLTLLLQSSAIPADIMQPLLLALVVTMLISPFGIRYNKTIARFLLREKGPPQRAIEREDAATSEVARREHVVLCGYRPRGTEHRARAGVAGLRVHRRRPGSRARAAGAAGRLSGDLRRFLR